MNSKTTDILDFGYEDMGENLIMAYGKLRGTQTDIVSAFVEKDKKEDEIVFTVTEISLDVEKIQVPTEKTGAHGKPHATEPIDTNRIGVLIEFLNKMVYEILLSESGSSRLIFPFVRGMDDAKHRMVKEGIYNADQVRLNTASRELIVICD